MFVSDHRHRHPYEVPRHHDALVGGEGSTQGLSLAALQVGESASRGSGAHHDLVRSRLARATRPRAFIAPQNLLQPHQRVMHASSRRASAYLPPPRSGFCLSSVFRGRASADRFENNLYGRMRQPDATTRQPTPATMLRLVALAALLIGTPSPVPPVPPNPPQAPPPSASRSLATRRCAPS